MAYYPASIHLSDPTPAAPFVDEPTLFSYTVTWAGSGSTPSYSLAFEYWNGSTWAVANNSSGDIQLTGAQFNPDIIRPEVLGEFGDALPSFGLFSAKALTGGSKTVKVRVYGNGYDFSAQKTYTVTAALERNPTEITPDPKLLGYAPQIFTPVKFQVPECATDRVLTGKQPTLFRRAYRSPAKVSRFLTGKLPVAFRQDYAKPPTPTARRLVGKGVILRKAFNRAPGEVTPDRVLAGKIPTAVVHYYRSPGVAGQVNDELSLEGQAPTSTPTDHHWITVARQRLIFTREAPGYEQGDNVWRGPGRIQRTLTGKIPVPQRTTNRWITVGRTQLYLTGKAPADSMGYVEFPAKGTLILAGKVPGFIIGYTIAPGAGSLTSASEKPILFGDVTEMTLSGKLPKAVYRRFMPVGGTALGLTGIVTDVANAGLIPGLGGAVLSGKAPRVVISSELKGKKGIISVSIRREIEFIATPIDYLTS